MSYYSINYQTYFILFLTISFITMFLSCNSNLNDRFIEIENKNLTITIEIKDYKATKVIAELKVKNNSNVNGLFSNKYLYINMNNFKKRAYLLGEKKNSFTSWINDGIVKIPPNKQIIEKIYFDLSDIDINEKEHALSEISFLYYDETEDGRELSVIEKQALEIGIKRLIDKFGISKIESEMPFTLETLTTKYRIKGNLQAELGDCMRGGVAYIELSKKDIKTISIYHTK